MTKKVFELVAKVLRLERPNKSEGSNWQWINVVRTFADKFEEENERFDRARFVAACGCDDEDARYCGV